MLRIATFVLALSWGLSPLNGIAAPADSATNPPFADHPENTWIKQSPHAGAPVPRFGWEGAAAYDPFLGKWLHWGGHDGIPQGFAMFSWEPRSGKWEQKFPDISPPGVCCVDGAETFDLAHRRFVRFPGAALGHGWQWFRSVRLRNSAFWLYDAANNSWTNMRPPPYKAPERYAKTAIGALNACGTYDENHELALSFGGQNASGGTNNLFAYDAWANELHRFDAASPPSPRDGSGFCYDSKNDCAIVFGSQYSTDEKTYIYRYSTNKWEAHDLSPRPTARKEGPYSTIPKMAFDSVNGLCLCVIWLGEKQGHETWAFDAARLQWTKLSPPAEPQPSKSRTRNLAYDRGLNVFFLETWTTTSEPQVWTYRYKKTPTEVLPEPPGDLTCLTSENGKASLAWTPSSTAGIAQYNVYRAQADKPWLAKFEKLATVNQTRLEDVSSVPGKTYFYEIRAIGADGRESRSSSKVRTQPQAPAAPIVSVLASNKIEIAWSAHAAKDLIGYNLYRGRVTILTSSSHIKSHGYNDPPYVEPVVDSVEDITAIEKLNDKPLTALSVVDEKVDLSAKGPESGDYKYAVYAYILRAVNRAGVESGPSPYVLTIPSQPRNLLLRETPGGVEIKWAANSEKGIVGYRVYKYGKQMELLTPEPVKETTFTHAASKNTARYSIVAIDAMGQEGEPSSPVWSYQTYKGFYEGKWHQ